MGGNLSRISQSVSETERSPIIPGKGMPMIMGSWRISHRNTRGGDHYRHARATGRQQPRGQRGSALNNPARWFPDGRQPARGTDGACQVAISQKTGPPPAVVGKVLAIATPLVLGSVGTMFRGRTWTSRASPVYSESSRRWPCCRPLNFGYGREIWDREGRRWCTGMLGKTHRRMEPNR